VRAASTAVCAWNSTGNETFEEDVLRNVRAEGAGGAQGVAAEDCVLEAPARGGECRGISLLACHAHECQTHAPRCCVAGSPRLAGAGVWSVPIRPKGPHVDPRIGEHVDDATAIRAHQPGRRGRRGNLHEDDVVESHAIERVLQREDPLDLVGFDLRLEKPAHRYGLHGSGSWRGDAELSQSATASKPPICPRGVPTRRPAMCR